MDTPGTSKDVMQEQVVPQLYLATDPRILNEDAEIDYQEGKIRVVRIDENLSVIVIQPEGITYEKAKGILLGISGYTMPPTSILGDNFTIPLMERLKETDSIAVFFAPYGRGSEKPITDQGRWTAGKIRRYTAMEAKRILEHFNGRDKKKWLAGHSLGGQTTAFMLANPEKYGFNDQDFDGALLYCPVPLADSQKILRSSTGPLGFNIDFIKKMPATLKPILRALLTGKGVEFDKATSKRLFFDDQDLKGAKEILKRLFPDSALYFLQALTVGTGKIKEGSLTGKRVGLMGAEGDTIITDRCMDATRQALIAAGANLEQRDIRHNGGHFSPFLMDPNAGHMGDSQGIQAKHRTLLKHVIQ